MFDICTLVQLRYFHLVRTGLITVKISFNCCELFQHALYQIHAHIVNFILSIIYDYIHNGFILLTFRKALSHRSKSVIEH
jgi:hypothetical protein